MSLAKAKKQKIINEYGNHPDDTGSTRVQIALLAEEIKSLTEHLKEHKHDHHSEYGLIQKVNQRRKLMKYLKKNDPKVYRELIQDLGIRDIKEAHHD